MIWTYLLAFPLTIIQSLFNILPLATTLPLVDGYLVTGIGYFNYIETFIPPLGIMMNGFLVLMTFKLTMFVLRALHIFR